MLTECAKAKAVAQASVGRHIVRLRDAKSLPLEKTNEQKYIKRCQI